MKTIILLIALLAMGCTPVAAQKVKPGDIFYIRWDYPDGIRKYRCIDTNKNGAFVKWCDAREWDNSAVEFIPNPQDQPTFKLIK